MKLKIAVTVVLMLLMLKYALGINASAANTTSQSSTRYASNVLTVEMKDNMQTPEPAKIPEKHELKQVQSENMLELDLRNPSGFTPKELESVTKYGLSGLGGDFAAQDSKVNSIFLIAVAALESGWGRFKLTQYNLFGMYRYVPNSYSECIEHVAAYLQTNYLTQGGEWYHGVTVPAVNTEYCVNSNGSPNTSWATRSVRSWH